MNEGDAGSAEAAPIAADRDPPLMDRLKEAVALYDTGDGDAQRRGATKALIAVVDEPLRAGVPIGLLRPLTGLVHGLCDLDAGVARPILQRRPVRPSLSSEEAQQRAAASAAMTLFMRADEGEEQAARRVARAVKSWPVAQRVRRDELWEAVRDWRERAMRQGSNDLDAILYGAALGFAEKHNVPPAALAAHLLTHWRDLCL